MRLSILPRAALSIPPIPKLLRTFHRTFLPRPDPTQDPYPSVLCTCSPGELLSQQPFGHLSPPPRVPPSNISERPESDFPSQLLSWQHGRHASIPTQSASQPASRLLPSLASPHPASPRPAPRRTRLAAGSLPACSASLLPSLSLPACLPPPPAPEAGTVQIEERGDRQAGWGPA